METISARRGVSPTSECTSRWPGVVGETCVQAFSSMTTWTSAYRLALLSSVSPLLKRRVIYVNHPMSTVVLISYCSNTVGTTDGAPLPHHGLCTDDRQGKRSFSSPRNLFEEFSSLFLWNCSSALHKSFQISLERFGVFSQLQTENAVVRERWSRADIKRNNSTQLC